MKRVCTSVKVLVEEIYFQYLYNLSSYTEDTNNKLKQVYNSSKLLYREITVLLLNYWEIIRKKL